MLFLQGELALSFAGDDGGDIVMARNVRIGRRIPILIVDAVDDAGELARATEQHALQPAAVIERLNLAGIGRAHGRQSIGMYDAGLHKIDTAVEFEVLEMKKPPRSPQ